MLILNYIDKEDLKNNLKLTKKKKNYNLVEKF